VLAEADEVETEAARHQAALDAFDARQQELQSALEEFTGLPWQVGRDEGSGGREVVVSSGNPRTRAPRDVLWQAVEFAKRKAWCLREIADGRDPHGELSEPFEGYRFRGIITGPDARMFYTDSVWGPNAAMPAPAYLRALAAGTADQEPAEPVEVPGPPPGWGADEVRGAGSGERIH
jgi:hypothetical protein